MRVPSFVAVPLMLACVLAGSAAVAVAQTAASDRPTILLTNDDGFDAPGLQALAREFAGHADLYIAAPVSNQTARGQALTVLEPVLVRDRKVPGVTAAWAMDATPASCVSLAFTKYLPKKPDLVVSGINRGENLGVSVFISGTVGAARQAVMNGVPAVAVSIFGNDDKDYASAAAYVRTLVDDLRQRNLLKPTLLLNVNVPAGAPKGVAVARLSTRLSQPVYECTPASTERSGCFYARYGQVIEDEPGTDVGEFYRNRVITVTPLTLDVTDAAALGALAPIGKSGAAVPAAPRP